MLEFVNLKAVTYAVITVELFINVISREVIILKIYRVDNFVI